MFFITGTFFMKSSPQSMSRWPIRNGEMAPTIRISSIIRMNPRPGIECPTKSVIMLPRMPSRKV